MINGEYKIDEPKKSRFKIFSLIILLGLLLLIVCLIYFFTKINRGASEQSFPVDVTVAKGLGTRKIADLLYDKKVINNPRVFMIYAIVSNASAKIQAGDYALDRKMSIVEIVDVLTAGKVTRSDKKVTIIEGWNNRQLAAYLAQRNIATESDFNKATLLSYDFEFADLAKQFKYEGFLFPDTYEISKSSGAESLIKLALKNFEGKFTDKMERDMTAKGLKTSDVIIMASIIEKEVGRNLDRPLTSDDLAAMQRERELVASVFYNRIQAGVALQSDATVNYVTGKADRSVTSEDLKVDSPYNTYKYRGLPPGPIGNPGAGSILAAIDPADSDYMYFLNKPDGVAVFAKSLEEHNSNKAKYLK